MKSLFCDSEELEMRRVVVVGSANVDFVVRTPHIPRPGETVLGRDFVMAMGGKGANQAVGAARLGGKVTFVANVGQDVFGQQCVEGYRAAGIDVQFVSRDIQEPTGVALISVAADGENSITVASGANMNLTPEHIEVAAPAFQEADIVLLQLEIPVDTVAATLRLARQHGVRSILNPAPARSLPRDLLGQVDVITPNRIEAAQLSGTTEKRVSGMDDQALAQLVSSLGPANAVITLGDQGALVTSSEGPQRISAFTVDAIDTTAAGDAFNAGLAVALADSDRTLIEAARYASACGALATTRLGAQPSLPTAVEVESFLSGSVRKQNSQR
jgi:ribokinase